MKKGIIILLCVGSLCACCFLACTIRNDSKLKAAQNAEYLALVHGVNHGSGLDWRAAVIQRMLAEANVAADRLKLPIKRPITMSDIQDDYVDSPWSDVIHGTNRFPDTIFGSHIFDSEIPREQRLRALKIGLGGRIDAANYEFGFVQGKLVHIMRMDGPETEYYARRLDELIGKPSLIDTNGAYQLATQWLSAVGVDVAELEKQSGPMIKGGHTVNQLHYLARGATNYVTLPLFYVDFGSQHFPASGNLHAFDESLVSVEVLGTTKELQELIIGKNSINADVPYDHGPVLLITNALELARTPNPSVKQLQNPATAQAYALTPTQVSNYSRNFPSLSAAVTNAPERQAIPPRG